MKPNFRLTTDFLTTFGNTIPCPCCFAEQKKWMTTLRTDVIDKPS